MIDPKEAPEGYEAVRGYCYDCCFFIGMSCPDPDLNCHASTRKDGETVIFRKVEE